MTQGVRKALKVRRATGIADLEYLKVEGEALTDYLQME